MSSLFKKYDIPVPRYTSYPTVPYWDETPGKEQWISHLNQSLAERNSSWSLYLHIPYCETLCTFCGCNTIITKDHSRETSYVDYVLKEWELYQRLVPEFQLRSLKQLHLGGGTPTFLSESELERLLSAFEFTRKDKDQERSIEVDPRRTRRTQLEVLARFGFNRISLGVQDFDPEVQRIVNRTQPYEQTKLITTEARELGYKSINFDLIYGLPKQSLKTMELTLDRTLDLRPDRIAFYSFALVPWIKPAQRLFKDEDLPSGDVKRELYEYGRTRFIEAGYLEIGMDHFALPNEALSLASQMGALHRNFMGYTDHRTDVLLGLGVSAISESRFSFHQNLKVLPQYERALTAGEIPTHRGHVHTNEDLRQREKVLKFITSYEASLSPEEIKDAEIFLSPMLQDKLVMIQDHKLKLTEKGRPFLRNACLFFDRRYREKAPNSQVFSKAI